MFFAGHLSVMFLVDMLCRGAVVIGTGMIAVLLMRKRSAAERHLVLTTALVSLLILPLLMMFLPAWKTLPQPMSLSRPTLHLDEIVQPSVNSVIVENHSAPVASTKHVPDRKSFDVINWLAPAWLVGCAICLLPLPLGAWRLRKLARSCRDLAEDPRWKQSLNRAMRDMKIRRPIALLASGDRLMPMTFGTHRPTIILPIEAGEWPDSRRRAVLLHEMAHIRRWDFLTHCFSRIACAVNWPNPLAWIALNRLVLERERACDDAVLQLGMQPSQYAEELLAVGSGMTRLGYMLSAAGAMPMGRPSRLARRISEVLADRRRATTNFRQAAIVVLAMMVLMIPLAVLRAAPPTTQSIGLTQTSSTTPSAKPQGFGCIVSPDGHPVAGAKVFAVSRDWNDEHTLATAITDAKGLFQIPATQQPVNLLVQAKGYGLSPAQLSSSTAEAQSSPSQLMLATILHVQVIGPDEKPAAGVKMVPEYLMGSRMLGWQSGIPPELQPALTQTTDAQGMCAFESLPAEARLPLGVLDDRFAQTRYLKTFNLSSTPISEGGVIHLRPASTVSGRITYADSHKPAQGVRVGAQDTDRAGPAAGGSGVTDAQGNFQIKQMSAGDFNIALDLKDDLANQYTAVAHEHVKLTDGQQLSGIDFELIHGGLIRGKLTVKGSERPVAGVEIGVYGPAHPRSSAWVQGTESKADGSYELRVPPGDQYVYLMSSPTAGLEKSNPSSVNTMIAEGQTNEVNFQFEERPDDHISGQAVDGDGKPVAGATIVSLRPTHAPMPDLSTARSDSNGNFTMQGVPAGSTVTARAGKLTTMRPTIVDQQHHAVTLVLRADAIGSVKVHVVHDDGSPLADATVSLLEWQGGFERPSEKKHTDSDGTCVFKDIYPDERYSIEVTAAGYGRAGASVHLAAGQQVELKPITPPKADSYIQGTVVDANGKAVPDVVVGFNGSSSGAQMTTDASGHFQLKDLVRNDNGALYVRDNKLGSIIWTVTDDKDVQVKYELDNSKSR